MSNASDRRQAGQIPGETNSYKTYTGKGNASKWQRSSKQNEFSTLTKGGGISAAKLNFLEEFKKFQDIKGLVGELQGMVEGGISSVGSQFASVFQDSVGNILENPGDTVKIPTMKKGGIVTSSSGNVMSGGKPVTWGAGPQYGTAKGFNMADVAGPTVTSSLPDLPSASDVREAGRLLQYLPQESDNSTANKLTGSQQTTNPLLDFETMNYVITLSCVSIDAYNNGSYTSDPGIIIAKTGGKGQAGTGPLSYDYYIERLTVRSTVAPTSNAFATNAYQIFFDVTEPLGVDLIPALIQASQSKGYKDHLSAVYLITINFVGNDDNGIPQKIPSTTRYVPIRLFKVDLSVDEGGGKYTIQAAPYNYLQQLGSYDKLNEAVVHSGTDVKSLVQNFFTELNVNQKQLKEVSVVNPHLYEFDISSSVAKIIKSKLGFGDPGSSANQSINVSPGIKGKGNPNLRSTRKVTVQKGRSIIEYLTHVVQNSKFMLNQFDSSNETKSEILSTVKIMVSTEIISSDNGMGEPQYKFKYALRHQDVAVESTNVTPVRTYNYIYTGQNKDVLDLDLKYQFAYFQPGRYYDKFQNQIKNNDDELAAETREKFRGNTGLTGTVQTASESADNINPDAPAQNREMAEVFRKILEDPAADLIVVDLTILGDPYWIEQKTIKPGNKQMTSDGQTEPDGSVSPDANNIVVQLNAKYPSDLDDETGLMKLDQSAFFQGKFKVFLCESSFEGGVFQNTISMTRFRDQENDKKFTGFKDPINGTVIPSTAYNFTDADVNREAFRGSTPNVGVKTKTTGSKGAGSAARRQKGGGEKRRNTKNKGGGKF